MRRLWVLLLLVCALADASPKSRNPVLLLVQQNTFTPAVDPNTFLYGYWVRWPVASTPVGSNRVLSVATGVDWIGAPGDFLFRPVPPGPTWRAQAFGDLVRRGHFRVRGKLLGDLSTALLLNGTGGTRSEALMLTLEERSPFVKGFDLNGTWPEDALMVAAGDGSELSAIRQRTSGRILVVEYPPRGEDQWSQIWLMGTGWPEGLMREGRSGMPGSVSAGRLLELAANPAGFRWEPPPPAWAGANRWFAFLRWATPFTAGLLGLVGAVLAMSCVYWVSQERRSPLLVALLRLFALAPAAMVLGSGVQRVAGLPGGLLWDAVLLLALAGVAAGMDLLWPMSRWTGTALLSLASVLAIDPGYAPLKTGEALGAAFSGATVAVTSLGWLRRRGEYLTLFGMSALGGLGAIFGTWWGESPFGMLGGWWVLVALIAQGRIRGWWLLLGAVLSPGLPAAVSRGFAFSPHGLIATDRDIGAVNLYELLRFLVSPAVLGSLFLLGVVAMFGSGFLARELWLGWRGRLEARVLFRVALACFLGGLCFPPLLHAALWCAFAGAMVVLDHLLSGRSVIGD